MRLVMMRVVLVRVSVWRSCSMVIMAKLFCGGYPVAAKLYGVCHAFGVGSI